MALPYYEEIVGRVIITSKLEQTKSRCRNSIYSITMCNQSFRERLWRSQPLMGSSFNSRTLQWHCKDRGATPRGSTNFLLPSSYLSS